MLNPDDFIIARKRKKYKFAKFANSPLCFEYDEWKQKPVDVIEIGAGTGLFSVALASTSSRQVVAVDVKGDRLQKGAYEAQEQSLSNIAFVRARADQLLDIATPHSVSALWITFPDPFPKKRSAGRRLTHPAFLHIYKQLLADTGALYLKHDNVDFFQWSLEKLVANGWHIVELSFDLHESGLSAEYKHKTTYEVRWLNEGLVTNFVKALPPKE